MTGTTDAGAGPRVVVSIHDIAPSTAAETTWLLDRFAALGITNPVLKVVPRWEDRDDLWRTRPLDALLDRDRTDPALLTPGAPG